MKKPIISVAFATITFVCISSAASADYLRVGEVTAKWEPLLAMGFMASESTVDGTEMRDGRIVPFRTQFDTVDRYVVHRDKPYGSCIIEVDGGRARLYLSGEFVTDRAIYVSFRCVRR